jgi:hypothetical protein
VEEGLGNREVSQEQIPFATAEVDNSKLKKDISTIPALPKKNKI